LLNQRVQDAVEAGQAAFEEGRFVESSNLFADALRLGPRTSEEEAIVRCHLSEALEKQALNREQLEAVAKYEKLAEYTRLPESLQMRVLTRLGWGYSFNNDIARAIALFNQALQIARKLDDPAGLGACYFGLGRAYRFISEIRIARDYYISALDYFRKVGNWRHLAESYFSIGSINGRLGDFRNAANAIKQSLAIIGDRNEHELLGRCYMDLALVYDNLEAPKDKVISCHEKSIEHLRLAGNSYVLAFNYNNLAMKLISLGDWQRAEELAMEAINLLKGIERIAHLYSIALDTLALLYLLQGRIGEADELIKESLYVFTSNRHPNESETHITMGRSHLAKGQVEEATRCFEHAVDICTRLGDSQFIADARLWLAEALLLAGRADEARKQVEITRDFLKEWPELYGWALMMRVTAKANAAEGHVAAAIQALRQSTSIYEIKEAVYDCALNRMVMADLMKRQGRFAEALREIESAALTFEKLGAATDLATARQTAESLRALEEKHGGASEALPVMPDLVSTLDGFLAERIVNAAVSRDLLLREIVSVAREQSDSRAVLLAEVTGEDSALENTPRFTAASSVGLSESERKAELEQLARHNEEEYSENHTYRLADNHGTGYLLRLIDPKAQRFVTGTVNIQPLLSLIEQSLEMLGFRSKMRRTQIFDPARLLAQVELPGFICASRAMSQVLEQIHKIRSSDVTVLITGESGTGKELIARAVHAGSSRRYSTFLPFNCSAAPKDMIESQLFGYRKGAFTGAVADNEGIIRAAERGTLFLDEIGDLPLELQPKLLRFLQEGEIHPLGANQPHRVDVRVVAATNSDLERGVKEGRFREDLFHRLNVIRIQVPALRQRREEIPALVSHYLTQYQEESAKRDIQISEEALDLMLVYDWPGNVRQLCNEVRRIVAYGESGTVINPEHLSPEILQANGSGESLEALPKKGSQLLAAPAGTTLGEAVEELERQMIKDALRRCQGNIARAAKELGLSRKGLYLKMDRLNFNG
jgi:DNA-binding NtrC family response regulator/tetratricopeptide (TPR) repeat protein